MLVTHSSTAKQEEKVKERGSCHPLATNYVYDTKNTDQEKIWDKKLIN
ncbi:MAG: hypothetical protein K8S23_15695 [Candidatus Cloacimonetes bacterium]|nr:hypothetical protein [Candidatus Cloacimonadota bacterium]